MRDTHRRLIRWAVPAVAATIGIGYLAAGLAGGNAGFGVFGAALMVVAGAGALLLARYSETVAALLDRSDERINSFDLTATAFAGTAVIATDLVMFVVEIARGHSGAPYYQIGAVGGLAYVLALGYQMLRR